MWSLKSISRNKRAYARIQAGLCQDCGGSREGDYRYRCNSCAKKRREYMRARTGCQPRVPYGTGRPVKSEHRDEIEPPLE